MASATEIKTRIQSIQDTQKITRAMYMISSTKLTKARKVLENTEPFFYELQNEIRRLVRHAPDLDHILFDNHERHQKERKTIGYIVVTGDKGMAGAYNHNVIKETERLIAESGQAFKLFAIGEVGRAYFEAKGFRISKRFRYTVQSPTMSRARSISDYMFQQFDDNIIDEVYIIYSRMVNRMNCEVDVQRILPLKREEFQLKIDPAILANTPQEEFLMYPDPETLLENVARVYLTSFVYGALVESFSSEQNARMQAMQSATDSANEMLHDLSIQYNRVRQAAITQEISEVIGGARALKRKKQIKMQQQNGE